VRAVPEQKINTIFILYDIAIHAFTMTQENMGRIRQAAPEAEADVTGVKDRDDREKQRRTRDKYR
jgi:hypothetical protein